MNLSDKMLKALNDQFNAELASAYLYGAMSADFKAKNLDGFAVWMIFQAKEEMAHARKIYDYIYDRGGRAVYQTMEAPQSEWESPRKALEVTLAHEEKVTAMIHSLVKLARQEDDLATESFLSWFVDEQVEEEDSVNTLLAKLELLSKAPNGVYLLDREMAMRGQN